MIRLDKLLVHSSFGSNSQVKKILKEKRVTINGKIITQGKIKIDEKVDEVKIDNEVIKYKPYRYFLLNKPAGYVSANADDRYPTILKFFENLKIPGLSHVGRLDLDTTGAILITNNGPLAHYLISPKSNVSKTYQITVDKNLNQKIIDKIKEGIILENGEKCLPAEFKIINETQGQLILHEGKYHQVKRMMRALGYEVIKLHRSSFAFLTCKNLNYGEYYELSYEEENNLLNLKKE